MVGCKEGPLETSEPMERLRPRTNYKPLSAIVVGLALTLNGQAQPNAAPPRSFAEFRPSEHGFAFRNSFQGSPLPSGLGALGGLGSRVGAPSQFGLCGGMSSAAADLFVARKQPPLITTPPASGSVWYEYLYKRQIDSLGPGLGMALRFVEWMRRPVDGPMGTRHLTLVGLAPSLEALDAGKPVAIGLVLVAAGDGRPVWSNHQVLGYGFAAGSRSADAKHPWRRTIAIYDPNFPKNDGVVLNVEPVIAGSFVIPGAVNVVMPVLGVKTTLNAPALAERPARTIRVRGWFAMPYEPSAPPVD